MANIQVFTDGSSLDNAAVLSFGGIGVYFPNGELDDISEPFLLEPITNQRAELYAIYTALEKITDQLEFDTVTIYSDSEYSIKSLTEWIHKWKKQGWIGSKKQDVKNRDIIEPIHNIMEKYPGKIKFVHVRAHTGKQDFESRCNHQADKLATAGSNRAKTAISSILTKKSKKSTTRRLVIETSPSSDSELDNSPKPKPKRKPLRVKT